MVLPWRDREMAGSSDPPQQLRIVQQGGTIMEFEFLSSPQAWPEGRVPSTATTLAACLAVALAFGSGCGRAITPEELDSVRDSAGTRYVSSSRPLEHIEEWELVPTGTVARTTAAAGSPLFGEVADAIWLSDGRILAVDSDTRQLLLFSSDGTLIYAFGGPGNGPGEFSQLGAVTLLPGDSIYAYDPTSRRVSVFHPEHGYLDSFTLPDMGTAMFPLAVWPLSPNRLVRFSIIPDPPPSGQANAEVRRQTSKALLELIDSEGRTIGRSVEFPGPWSGSANIGEVPAPFSPSPAISVGEGGVMFAPDHTFHLVGLDTSFAQTLDIKWPSAQEPLRHAELSRLKDAWYEIHRTDAARATVDLMFHNALAPPMRPAIGGLVRDASRRTWIARFEPRPFIQSESRWLVLDTEGLPRMRVSVPARARLDAAEGDRALLTLYDRDDVASVGIYRLQPKSR